MKGDGAMGHQDARMREYDRMTRNGLSPMTSCEIVEEAKDTIKEMEKVLKLFRGRYLEMGLAQSPEVVRCNKVLKKLKGEE